MVTRARIGLRGEKVTVAHNVHLQFSSFAFHQPTLCPFYVLLLERGLAWFAYSRRPSLSPCWCWYSLSFSLFTSMYVGVGACRANTWHVCVHSRKCQALEHSRACMP